MFGRRRHRATTQRPSMRPGSATRELAPDRAALTAAIQRVLADEFGRDGRWTLVRRGDEPREDLFHEAAAASIASQAATSVLAALDHAPDARHAGERRVAREREQRIADELGAVAAWASPTREELTAADATPPRPPLPAVSAAHLRAV